MLGLLGEIYTPLKETLMTPETHEFKLQGWFITIWKESPSTYGYIACRGYGIGIMWKTGDVNALNKGKAIWEVLAKLQSKNKPEIAP